MIKSMTNHVVCTLVHHKGKSWEIQGKCINRKKKKNNSWRNNLTMIVGNWYARSSSLVKAIINHKMLNCFVATIMMFYQLIQLSFFVTVGSLTLVTAIKIWLILMIIIQYSWVQPWSILKRIHWSFVSFC